MVGHEAKGTAGIPDRLSPQRTEPPGHPIPPPAAAPPPSPGTPPEKPPEPTRNYAEVNNN